MNKYVAQYFIKTKKIVQKYKADNIVLLQFFQRKNYAVLCGINEVIKFLKKYTDTSKYIIRALKEKTIIKSLEVVLELEGPYQYFGVYEGIIDGILSRLTSLATNASNIKKIANGKKLVFMGDRSDYYLLQPLDGYAISMGGITTQVTNAQTQFHNGKAIGTIPHALIQIFNGNLVEALEAYSKTFPNEKLTALVDFNNDVLTDTLNVLNRFSKKLNFIRIDTSIDMSDKMFPNNEEFGVTSNMIKKVRKLLNQNNGKHVKIIVTSGLNVEKITNFEKLKTPVDVYGIGSGLLKINNTFSADAVKINGKKLAKAGRRYRHNSKLKKINTL